MKKIELNLEQIQEALRLYNEELKGSSTISEIMGFHKTIIRRTLSENGIIFGPSGRRNTGGKIVAQKRYESKPEIKKRRVKYHSDWSKENRGKLREYHTEWRDKNREHVTEYGRNYEKTRRANDPKYRLTARTRTALYTCLKEAKVDKYRSTFQLLGYSIEELMQHLEKLFVVGMTWENYGEWHVDHKLPIASFNFTSIEDEEFKRCWELSNLQPLWGADNLSKGCKI